LGALVEKPALANTVLANASAIFSWAVREEIIAANPCSKIEMHEIAERTRVLANSEVPLFWSAFGKTEDPMAGLMLKVQLLCGQRGGEIVHMRREPGQHTRSTARGIKKSPTGVGLRL
jgi:integrase